MDNNGNSLAGDLVNGGVITGNLDIQGDTLTESLGITGKYVLPLDPPPEPNAVITSDGTQTLVWSGDLSTGDVSSATGISVNNEMVLYNGITGKSIKNSGLIVNNQIISNKGLIMTNTDNNTESALLIFKKQREIFSVLAGDQLGKIQFEAFNALSGYSEKAHIRCRAVGDITGGNFGTQMYFAVTNEGGSLTSKLLIWDDGTQIFDNLISPNLYCGGDKGLTMYLEGDGDKIDIKDKNNNVRMTIDETDTTINKRLKISDTFGTVQFEADDGGYSVLNGQGEYVGFFGDTMQSYYYTNNALPVITLLSKSRGTESAPLSLLINDRISETRHQGHAGGGQFRIGATMITECTENWGISNAGTKMTFATNNIGSLSQDSKLLLDDNGVTVTNNNLNVEGALTIGDNTGVQYYTLPATKGNDGEHLQLSGNYMIWAPDQNSGDVTGPNTSVQNEIVTYSGNTGKVIKNSDGYIEGGQITCFQGFQSALSLGYKLYNNNQVTYTVTGTALTDLIPNIVNSFFPVNNASFNWTGKKVRVVIRGTLLCANNARMFINIGFLNKIFTAQGTGQMSTANVSPGKKVTFTFEVDFRSNPNVIHFYEYRMDLSLFGGNTQYVKSIYLNDTIDQTVSTQPLFIRAYWDTNDINNQFLCRSTEVYII
ncbi:MAG: hypothetical protein ACW98D_14050 [Promethearchaeota archaeon]|jgi:hypothetical protein